LKCTTEAFEEEGTAPEASYNLVVSAGDGGNVSSTGGSFKSEGSIKSDIDQSRKPLFQSINHLRRLKKSTK